MPAFLLYLYFLYFILKRYHMQFLIAMPKFLKCGIESHVHNFFKIT